MPTYTYANPHTHVHIRPQSACTHTYVRALRSQLARGQISLQTISFLLLSAIQRGRVEGRGKLARQGMARARKIHVYERIHVERERERGEGKGERERERG